MDEDVAVRLAFGVEDGEGDRPEPDLAFRQRGVKIPAVDADFGKEDGLSFPGGLHEPAQAQLFGHGVGPDRIVQGRGVAEDAGMGRVDPQAPAVPVEDLDGHGVVVDDVAQGPRLPAQRLQDPRLLRVVPQAGLVVSRGQLAGAHLDGHQGPVPAPQGALEDRVAALVEQVEAEGLADQFLRREEAVHGHAEQLVLVVAGEGAGTVVDFDDPAPGIYQHDGLDGVLHQGAAAGLAFGQGCLRGLAAGDVPGDEQASPRAVLVPEGIAGALHPVVAAVARAEPVFVPCGLVLREEWPQPLSERPGVLGMDEAQLERCPSQEVPGPVPEEGLVVGAHLHVAPCVVRFAEEVVPGQPQELVPSLWEHRKLVWHVDSGGLFTIAEPALSREGPWRPAGEAQKFTPGLALSARQRPSTGGGPSPA